MNILLMIDAIPLSSPLGGASRITWDTATGLVARGHAVTVLTASYAKSLPPEKDGVRIVSIPALPQRWAHYRSVYSKKRAQEVMKIIDDVKPDLIHAHVIAWQCGYRWIPLARKKGISILVTCHDVMNIALGRILPDEKNIWLKDLKRLRWSWNPFRASSVKTILEKHCILLTVSDALRDCMKRFGYRKLRTLHNGIDLSFWKETCLQDSARTALNLPRDRTIFLLAGRLGIDKGTEAIERLLPGQSHLIIAGDLDKQSFASIVHPFSFFSNQSPAEMRMLYAACDCVVIPSRCLDCFPTIALEAMACGRPVLATSWGGAKEAVQDKKTGWVIDPLDEDSWKKHMSWCVTHREQLKTMGKAARVHMEKNFSQERYLHALLALYAEATDTLS